MSIAEQEQYVVTIGDRPLTLTDVRQRDGIAGQVEVGARIIYSNGEESITRFYGSVYGGPITMSIEGTLGIPLQIRVEDPKRFGERLDREWVLRFYGVEDDQ